MKADLEQEQGSIQGLANTREVVFAIAIALRYLYFWTFVATRPAVEPSLDAPDGMHSGAWKRWGIAGLILKWILFAAVLDIAVLQILWRVVPNLQNVGPVYLADCAIEIVASALLVIKLSANVWITPVLPRWRVIRGYMLPVAAILFGMAVAIGNLAYCKFLESALSMSC